MSQHHGEILFRRLQTQVINMLFFQNKWIVENGLAMVWVAEAALKWNIEVQVFYFVFGRRPQPCQRVNDYIPLTIPLEPICFAPRKRSRGLWFQFFCHVQTGVAQDAFQDIDGRGPRGPWYMATTSCEGQLERCNSHGESRGWAREPQIARTPNQTWRICFTN